MIVLSTLFTRVSVALNASIAELNCGLAAACDNNKCDFVDLNATMAPTGEFRADLTLDGVHLTAQGYILWRDALQPHLSACHAPHFLNGYLARQPRPQMRSYKKTDGINE